MKAAVFAVPGDLATPTGGYAYDRRIIAGARRRSAGRSRCSTSARAFRARRRTRAPRPVQRLAALPPDGRSWSTASPSACCRRPPRRCARAIALVALVHHPLALESGLSADEAAALRASERAALARARHVIATSAATARLLAADYGVPPERLSVVEPGTDRVRRAAARRRGGCRAARRRRRRAAQGLRRARRRAREARAICPGGSSLPAIAARSPETVGAARGGHRAPRSRRSRHPARRRSPPSSSRRSMRRPICSCCRRASKATAWPMPRRIAHGVPVVGTTAGAIPETVPAGAGVLVRAGRRRGARGALRRLIEHPARARAARRRRLRARRHAFPPGASRQHCSRGVLETLA